MCDNDVHLEPDNLGRDLGDALGASLRPAILYRDGATLDPAERTQSLRKSRDVCTPRRSFRAQEPYSRELPLLLRARRERPRSRCSAEQRDERASSHSITSSARASSVGGTSKPKALAVFRLTTNSNLVPCCTGRSAGFAPLRILSTKLAERYHMSLMLAE